MPTVECPGCGDQFYVVYPEEEQQVEGGGDQQSTELDARLVSWSSREPRHPYSAARKMSEEQINELIQRVETTIKIDGVPMDFEFFQKPADRSHFWTHVVRADTDVGRKSKNAVVTDDGELYIKNRGVPWDEEKQWTYLSKEQLRHRSEIAGLGGVIEVPDSEGGLGLLLGEKDRPVVVEGELQERLVLKLAKALLVMQSKENPMP